MSEETYGFGKEQLGMNKLMVGYHIMLGKNILYNFSVYTVLRNKNLNRDPSRPGPRLPALNCRLK